MATGNVVKFPTARIVERRTFMHHLEDTGASAKRIAIEAELYSVSHAIDALGRQRKSLVLRLRRDIHDTVAERLGRPISDPRIKPVPAGDAA